MNYEVGILIIVIHYLIVNYVKGPLYRPSFACEANKKKLTLPRIEGSDLVCYSMYILIEVIILPYFSIW